MPGLASADSTPSAVADVAKTIAKAVKSRNDKFVAIDQIQAPKTEHGSTGPFLASMLEKALKDEGIEIRKHHSLAVKGSYHKKNFKKGEVNNNLSFGVHLTGVVEDTEGNVVENSKFTTDIVDSGLVAILLVITFEIPPTNDVKVENDALRRASNRPSVYIDNSKVYASDVASYGVEILVNGRPLRADDVSGEAFVKMNPGDKYKVRLWNNTKIMAAVRLRVDGLNFFTFTNEIIPGTDDPKYDVVLINPNGGSVTIDGWHLDNSKSREFKIETLDSENTALAMAKKRGIISAGKVEIQDQDIGLIQAHFMLAWKKSGNPPPEEEGTRGLATGFGDEIKSPFVADVEYTYSSVVRSAVCVRYSRAAD